MNPHLLPNAVTMREKLRLSPGYFVGEGAHRKCFRHPGDANRCIKVLHSECDGRRFWGQVGYYSRLQRRGVDFQQLTPCREMIDTNLGKGLVFDLVLDDDGRISRSLEYYLQQNDRRFNEWIVTEIEQLKQNLYDQWVVFHDLNPAKILVKRLGFDEFQLVVIDAVGHNQFIPLANYSSLIARRKLVRIWNRHYRQWYEQFPGVVGLLKPYQAS
jgi:hypothetical protein